MSIRHYRRKPRADDLSGCSVSRYEPGRPLSDLLAVARMADDQAEVAEVAFPSGRTALVVRWTDMFSEEPEPEHAVIQAGFYLAYGESYGHLYDTDDADLEQFYVPGTGL